MGTQSVYRWNGGETSRGDMRASERGLRGNVVWVWSDYKLIVLTVFSEKVVGIVRVPGTG